MPPEAHSYNLGPYSYDSDVFSLHVVMWEVIVVSGLKKVDQESHRSQATQTRGAVEESQFGAMMHDGIQSNPRF